MNRSRSTALTATLLAALALACTDDGTRPPVPGTVVVSLTTPAPDDGAISMRLTGPGIGRVETANSSHRAFWRLVSADELRIILVGSLTSGPLFTAEVADVGDLGAYQATVFEVAGKDDRPREGTNGYQVVVGGRGRP